MLNEFLAVAKTVENGSGSFVQAAKSLNTYPSTLSKHIKLLEDELGAPLFDRTTRRVSLSDFGRFFLPHAQEMYDSYKSSQIAVEQYNFSPSLELRFGTVVPIAANNKYMRITRMCAEKYPDCRFRLVERHNRALKDMLRSGTLEFILAYQEDNDTTDFTLHPLESDNLVAIAAAEHPLCSKKHVSLEMLRNENIITNPLSSYMGNFVYSACQAAGYIPYVWYSDHTNSNLANVVDRGGGVGLMMESSARYLIGPNTRIIPLEPALTLQLCFLSLRERKLSPVAETFLAQLQEMDGSPSAQEGE